MTEIALAVLVSFICGLLLGAALANEDEKNIEKRRIFTRNGKVYRLTEITSD